MKKTVFILTMFVMLALVFTGCSGGGDVNTPGASGDNTASADTTAVPEAELTEEELKVKKVNDTVDELSKVDFEGDTITFFVRGSDYSTTWYNRTVYAEEVNNEMINDATFQRNEVIREKMGVSVEQSECYSKWANTNPLIAEIRTLILAGDESYDVYTPTIRAAATLSLEGLLYEFDSIPHINLDAEWWDQSYRESMSIEGSLYSAIGDIFLLDKLSTRAIYFNKTLVENHDLEDPYELVRNDEWNLDKMYEMAKKVGSDIDSNGVMNEFDRYGLMGEIYTVYYLFNGAGCAFSEKDEEGYPIITIMNDREQSVLSKIMNIYYDTTACYNVQGTQYKRSTTYSSDWDVTKLVWRAERALFFETGFNNLENYRDLEFDFGVVPYPKFDENQEKYYSGFYKDGPAALCVPITNTNLEMTGAVIEALCAQSSITTMEAFYEIGVEGKYTRDEEAKDTIALALENRVYDIAMLFDFTGLAGSLSTPVRASSTDFASSYARVSNSVDKAISDLVEQYKNAKAEA